VKHIVLAKPYDKNYGAAVIADISVHFYDNVELKLKFGVRTIQIQG
jgi:hypothetical protein